MSFLATLFVVFAVIFHAELNFGTWSLKDDKRYGLDWWIRTFFGWSLVWGSIWLYGAVG